MDKPELKERSDVRLLVETFYGKIRKHEILGSIFNRIISDWNSHLTLLTDFWETQLFLKRKYHGNPVTAHQEVNKIKVYRGLAQKPISQKYFKSYHDIISFHRFVAQGVGFTYQKKTERFI